MAASNGDDADTTSRHDDLGPVLEDTPPRLRFTFGPWPQGFPLADAPGFIDDALARHADAQIDSLEISLVFPAPFGRYMPCIGNYVSEHPHATLIEADHVRAWLRYGMARATKSFVLEVPPPENEGMAHELPASAAAVSMALTLGNATITLPAPDEASFHALTELVLSNARIDDWDRLGDLLSSPPFYGLKRLRLEYLVGVAVLSLVSELEELTITGASDLVYLLLDAPRLRTLCVTDCSTLESERGELVIYAPALVAFTCSNMCKLRGLEMTAPSVQEIGKLPLWTHGHADPAARNEASIWILNHCTTAHRLDLHLHVPSLMREFLQSAIKKYSGMVDYENILVGEIPALPNITVLTVTISTWNGHSYAASLAGLIAQCVNLEELHIEVKRDPKKPTCLDQPCVCHNDHGWENQNISLERLRYLDITGFQGLDYEKRLTEMILAGAPAVGRMKFFFAGRE